MRFSVESWAPDYGVAADDTQLEEAAGTVDPSVEVPAAAWSPIAPDPTVRRPDRVLFVDGVRRIDARVWITDGATARPGVCASVASGAVLCTPGSAVVDEVAVVRGLFAAASAAAEPIVTRHGTYELFPCAGDGPEELYLGIHEQMTRVESTMGMHHEVDLVVFDGPLRGRNDRRGLGYVKTQHVQYLPPELHAVLGRLDAGERTPLFLIGGGGGFTRYSWYLRLPGPRPQPLAGIVRCELVATVPVAAAADRARLVSATLPVFASVPHKDARAPQNLYPIAGLEHRLRHRLGDPQVLERALRRAAASPASAPA